MIWCSTWRSKYFMKCNDRNDGDCKNFGSFIAWIEITMNFEKQKVLQAYSQSPNSSNFNHSKITFSLNTFYFLTLYFETCVMNLLVSILKRRKKKHSSLGWKWVNLHVGYRALIGNVWFYLILYITSVVNGSEVIESTYIGHKK